MVLQSSDITHVNLIRFYITLHYNYYKRVESNSVKVVKEEYDDMMPTMPTFLIHP